MHKDWHPRPLTAVPLCRLPSLLVSIGPTWTRNSCVWQSTASNGSSGRSTGPIHCSRPRPWTLTACSLRFSPQIILTIRRELWPCDDGAALASWSSSTPNSSVRETIITDITPPLSVELTPQDGTGAIAWGALAAEIGKSLLRPVASEIGSAIFAKLFPPGVPAYFDQVYKEFENIVQGVINENKRRELNGRVNAVQDGMITYNTIKGDRFIR